MQMFTFITCHKFNLTYNFFKMFVLCTVTQ